MSVQMIDGTTSDVPAILARFGPHQPVAGYVTGPGIEWLESQFDLFARKIRIAQSFDLAVDEASDARVLDVERGAATADDWPAFYASRTNKADATCYASLSTVPRILAVSQPDERPQRWWLAWYWQQPGQPTVEQVLAELERVTGMAGLIEPAQVWAVQYASYPEWDVSAVYGTPDFSRR